MRSVVKTGRATLATNDPASALADVRLSIDRATAALAAIACPLRTGGDWIDLLYLLLPPQYGTPEWLALTSMVAEQCHQADATWAARLREAANAAIERELAQAARLQAGLVPKDPRVPGLDVAIGFRPCRWVGGDYVDALPTQDGRVLLVIADVCGKGMHAALVAAQLHAIVHSAASLSDGTRSLTQAIDRYLTQHLPGDAFVTLATVLIDPRDGAYECLNAGHPPPLIVAADGKVTVMPVGDNGMLRTYEDEWIVRRGQFQPGQWLVMYTDGISEMPLPNPEARGPGAPDEPVPPDDGSVKLLGVPGTAELVAEVARRRPASAAAFKEWLDGAIDDVLGARTAQDDRTFLVARIPTAG